MNCVYVFYLHENCSTDFNEILYIYAAGSQAFSQQKKFLIYILQRCFGDKGIQIDLTLIVKIKRNN